MNEVQWSGTVVSPATFFRGTRTHAVHEQFDVRRADGATFRVIDNVDLAPRVPVAPGDRVTVRGELVTRGQNPPIVHWTHYDPRGRHPDGWIEYAGRRYSGPGVPRTGGAMHPGVPRTLL
jgi:hypothetical protein